MRPAIIGILDEAAERVPGDDWIAGHRVGMRVKQGMLPEAVAAAAECRATHWWCAALHGFALHESGLYPEAEEAFERALNSMPHDQLCAWRHDLVMVLSGDLATRFAGADCEERGEIETLVWWLADPLYLQPANDRRTEQFARMVGMRLHHELIFPRECLDPHHAGLLRRDWPDWWWSNAAPPPAVLPEDGVPDHDGFGFIPPAEVVRDPRSPETGVWGATRPRSLHEERYNPHYGPFFTLDQQTGFLARGDSLLVAAAANTATSGLDGARTVTAGIVLSRAPDDEPVMVVDDTAPGTHRFILTVPDDAWLISVEALASDHGAARARFGHRLPERVGAFGLSDILLFDWDDDIGEQLDDVLPRMLGTTRLERDRKVGIYWEMYGVDRDDDIEITLRVTPHESGFLRRLGESLRLVGRRAAVGVEWQDQVGRTDIVSRTLQVDLGSLSRGTYTLEVQARDGAGATVVARRDIEIL